MSASSPSIVVAAPSTESLQSWARLYAASGLSPLPLCPPSCSCPSPGKNPHRVGWNTQPPSLDEVLRESGTAHNLGVVIPESYLVIDVDTHSAAANGTGSLRRLQQDVGLIPDTPRSVTGGGGQHIWLRLPANWRPLTSAQHIARYPGLDFLFSGRQVVEAPSVHVSGGPYLWLRGYEPGGKAFAAAPAAILAMLNQAAPPSAPVIPAIVRTDRRMSARVHAFIAGQVPPGKQDNEAWACAVSLRASGFPEAEVAALLWQGMRQLPVAGRPWEYEADAMDMARRAFAGPLPARAMNASTSAPAAVPEEAQPHVSTLGDVFRSDPAAMEHWGWVTLPDEIPDDLPLEDRQLFEGTTANPSKGSSVARICTSDTFPPLTPGSTPEDYRARARERFPVPKGVKPALISRFYRRKKQPSEVRVKPILATAHYNPYNFAVQQQQMFVHYCQLFLEDPTGIWIREVAVEDFDEKARRNLRARSQRRGGEGVWFDNAEAARSYVLYVNRAIPGSTQLQPSEIEERLAETVSRVARPHISQGRRSPHWFSSTRGWAMRRKKPDDDASQYELVGSHDGEPDAEQEERVADGMGFVFQFGEVDLYSLRRVGPERIYRLPAARVAELNATDPHGAAREAVYFVQRCGYRLVPKAYREIYGEDPPWLQEMQRAQSLRGRRPKRARTPKATAAPPTATSA